MRLVEVDGAGAAERHVLLCTDLGLPQQQAVLGVESDLFGVSAALELQRGSVDSQLAIGQKLATGALFEDVARAQ
ncbi:hypothetical protein DBR42_16865 [Pelomonas sp. HMWF004]|nr:hypothetical protein DBR42_16865 [Pelomonas sp. HMWF004]